MQDIVNPDISVVIPVFDEEDSLRELVSRLKPVLEASSPNGYEIVFVDDGSRDKSWERIKELHANLPEQVFAIRHRRMVARELAQSFDRRRFIAALRRLIPEIQDDDLVPGGAGVRAQAVDENGKTRARPTARTSSDPSAKRPAKKPSRQQLRTSTKRTSD